jgi:c-di-GMP-binding flagellar brake protein YcgR
MMSFDGDESRRHPRKAHTDNIEFCVNSTNLGATLQGTLIDISESGMCLYTFKPISEGQNIIIKSALPVPYHRANVRWVKKYSDDLYKVGLMFIE